MSSTRSRGRVAVALAAALLAGAGAAWATGPETENPAQGPTPSAATDGPSPGRGTAVRKVVTAAPPTSITIARIGVRMPVLGVGVASDGQMALPPNPANVGWYSYGPRPGDSTGATVLAAHIDTPRHGIGPLARLGELRQGDLITVESRGAFRRYVISSTRQLEKTSLDLTSLFARTGPPRLHLITCGGDFDQTTRHYEKNVVVLAFPVP